MAPFYLQLNIREESLRTRHKTVRGKESKLSLFPSKQKPNPCGQKENDFNVIFWKVSMKRCTTILTWRRVRSWQRDEEVHRRRSSLACPAQEDRWTEMRCRVCWGPGSSWPRPRQSTGEGRQSALCVPRNLNADETASALFIGCRRAKLGVEPYRQKPSVWCA